MIFFVYRYVCFVPVSFYYAMFTCPDCQASNADVKGVFYDDPGNFEGDSAIFDEAYGMKPFAYTYMIPGNINEQAPDTVA